MNVFMVYYIECDSSQDYYEDAPIGVFRTPQDIADATNGEVPADCQEWKHPSEFSGYDDKNTRVYPYGDCGEYVIVRCEV